MARRKAIKVLQEPLRRRAWLLTKALEAHPLDRALELARAAEVFITQSGAQAGEESLASNPQPNIQVAKAKTPTGLSISAEQRGADTAARGRSDERRISGGIRFVATPGTRNSDGICR